MSDASARTADFPAPIEPVMMSNSTIASLTVTVGELAGVFGGVEVTEGLFDEAVGGKFPGFEAADANFFARAARGSVCASESPVIFVAGTVLFLGIWKDMQYVGI